MSSCGKMETNSNPAQEHLLARTIDMNTGKVAIGITAAAFTGFGTALLVKPEILKKIGIRASGANGRTELRAMYGGMELGFGMFFAMAVLKPEWRRPALAAILLGIGGLGATRIATAISEHADPISYLMAGPEVAAAAMAGIALASDRSSLRTRQLVK